MKIEDILGKLVSYETVSEKNNEDLADFIIKFLQNQGISAQKIRGEKGRFNIYSRIGPDINGGIILSGHTDVVPTTGQ
jgi:acetylornithine deacetylase